ncbi:MAG: hypothetical protein HYV35_07450 [Lentisphaerae bacterium]|nr:hypothetical protein [Lentisphaerota bacterium]
MVKSILGITLLMVSLLELPAGPDQETGSLDKATAPTGSVSAMMSRIAEIGAILKEGRVVYDPELLTRSVPVAVVLALDLQGAILTKDQAERRMDEEKGMFYGIGCKLRLKDKWPQIVEISSNSPAATAKLAISNLIVKIGNKSTEGLTVTEIARLLQGGKGEELELTIRADEKATETPPDQASAGQERVVKLVRSLMQMPVTGTTETWPQGIGYLKVNGLYTNSGAVIAQQFDEWRHTNCFGIILDIRGANGIDLESVAEIGSLFARTGETLFVLRNGLNAVVAAYQAKALNPLDKPIMVLIDHDTSGAAEALAGLLSVFKGAMLVGTPTRGDDRLRDIIPLADGRVLYIATRRIELSKGPDFYRQGVSPHVRVTATNEPAGAMSSTTADEEPDIFAGISEQELQDRALIKRIGDDAVLRRAADILLSLKALDFKVR